MSEIDPYLLKQGDGYSSEGSDSAPSEDNLENSKLNKNLPIEA